jgi:hypothetical protein
MPIYSDNEAETEDRLASLLAGAGATTSMAASAAAALKANPEERLSPRLTAALASTLRQFERANTVPDEVFRGESTVRFPEELVARLAHESPMEAQASPRDFINLFLADLKALLEAPTSDVASRVEAFLRQLSEIETAQAQSLARGSLELELLAHPMPTF